jgi:hypothetical protein
MNTDNIQTVKKINSAQTGDLVSYKITTTDNLIMYAPANDERNTEYMAIQEWVAEGNTIQEAD